MPAYKNYRMLPTEKSVPTRNSFIKKTMEKSELGLGNDLKKQLSQISRPKLSQKKSFSGNQPAVLERGPLRFVITDSPSNQNMIHHVKELKELKVRHVCRASEPTYSAEPLKKSGFKVHDLAFPDGDAPPDPVLRRWLKLVENCFVKKINSAKVRGISEEEFAQHLDDDERISVHCVAGLGRAPVLVAVALVEFCNLDPLEAVAFIRQHRRGAINKTQLKWLEHYIPKYRSSIAHCGCVIS